jgi:hypothetical protein
MPKRQKVETKGLMQQDLAHLRLLFHQSLPDLLDATGFTEAGQSFRGIDVGSKDVLRRALRHLQLTDTKVRKMVKELKPLMQKSGQALNRDLSQRLARLHATHYMIQAVTGTAKRSLQGQTLLN